MSVRILIGDCREKLRELPDASVNCCVTSPPYFGLRDYGCDGQMGLEPTPDEFVAGMVAVFREVRRVLRDDGTLWLNIGDSYANDGKWGGHTGGKHAKALHCSPIGRQKRYTGLKPKDLIGTPWLLAFALRADGWYLRQDIIWSKPNPMPESVRDRCTKAHEHIFLLSKSPRYYFDADAIREECSVNSHGSPNANMGAKAENLGHGQGASASLGKWTAEDKEAGRNKRSVWEVATQPFSEAHFATYPPALIEPCILAGCPERCCAKCGSPVVRVTVKGEPNEEWKARCGADSSGGYNGSGKDDPSGKAQNPSDLKRRIPDGMRHKEHSFEPTCACDAGMVSGTVLDPFFGAGTTGLVADRLGRDCIGIELNPEYAAIAERRLNADAPLFAEVKAA